MSDLSDSFLPGLKARSKAGWPGLKARSKDRVEDALQDIDQIGDRRGFVDREPVARSDTPERKKPGRKPSPRTQQLHPRVLPATGQAFLAAAKRRRLSQGQMFEILWEKWTEDE